MAEHPAVRVYNELTREQIEKTKAMVGAWQRVTKWARQYGTKVTFGTDLLFDPEGASRTDPTKPAIALVPLAKRFDAAR